MAGNRDSNRRRALRLGVSSCLLGNCVRFDGFHRLDPYLAQTLAALVEYVPVCPEVECGLGVPRHPMSLVGTPECPRLITTSTGEDHTERMLLWAGKRLTELEGERLCGFVFKSRSPSCGITGVKLYERNGEISNRGVGLFARAFMERFPLLPTEDEDRLRNVSVRAGFLEGISAASMRGR